MSTTVSIVCVLYETLLTFNRFKCTCNCTESELQLDGP